MVGRRGANLRVRLGILARALRWRGGSAAMLLVVAAVAIAGAAVGPMFLQSANDSVLASTVAAAPPGSTNVSFLTSGAEAAAAEITAAAELARRSAGDHFLLEPLLTADIGTHFTRPGVAGFTADVLWRSAICGHLQFVGGRCPTAPDTVAISARSAALAHVGIGGRIPVTVGHQATETEMRIVGLYLQPTSVANAYWVDVDYFAYGTSQNGTLAIDPLVASESTVISLATTRYSVEFVADLAWRQSSLVVGKARLEGALGAVKHALGKRYGLAVSTSLPSVLSGVQHDENVMSSVVLAIVLQLVLLALLVLYALGRSTASARRIEAEFARRRGFPRTALLSLAVAEPAALITVALPIGILVAWVAMKLAAPAIFVRGTPVSITGLSLAAAAGGYVAALLATTLASYVLWQRSRREGARRLGTAAAVLDAFGVALALAGLLALATRGALNGAHADPLAAVAPGLLALGAAVIGLRLVAALVGALVRSSHESHRVAWFLALRQVSRRPEVLRRLFPLTVATAVVLFAVGSFVLAADNRSRAARFEIGADRVVTVGVPPGVDLVQAVRRADPSGRQAMAAAVYAAPSGNLIAVDATRFAAVASWPSGLSSRSAAEIGRQLSPSLPPAVTFSGERLRLKLTVPARTPGILLTMGVFDEAYQTSDVVNFGPTRPGTHTYAASLGGACSQGCRLVSLSPGWFNPNVLDQQTIRIGLDSMGVDRPTGMWRSVSYGADRPGTWRSLTQGVSIVSDRDGTPGLSITASADTLVTSGEVVPNDLPPSIPAVVTFPLEAINPPAPQDQTFAYEGLDGNPVTLAAIQGVSALPAVGTDAALIDLSLAERAQTDPAVYTTDEVWLSPSASPAILGRLRQNGIEIGSTTFASRRLASLDHSGLALSYDLALIVIPIAALLAIGAIVFAIAAEGRRRRHEIAALGTVGLGRSVIRRALVTENLVVLFSALVVGGGIGFAADALALSSLPQFASGSGGLPLVTAIPVGYLFAALGVLAVALVASAGFTSRLITRQAFSGESLEER